MKHPIVPIHNSLERYSNFFVFFFFLKVKKDIVIPCFLKNKDILIIWWFFSWFEMMPEGNSIWLPPLGWAWSSGRPCIPQGLPGKVSACPLGCPTAHNHHCFSSLQCTEGWHCLSCGGAGLGFKCALNWEGQCYFFNIKIKILGGFTGWKKK